MRFNLFIAVVALFAFCGCAVAACVAAIMFDATHDVAALLACVAFGANMVVCFFVIDAALERDTSATIRAWSREDAHRAQARSRNRF